MNTWTIEFSGLTAVLVSADKKSGTAALLRRYGHTPRLVFRIADLDGRDEGASKAGPFGGIRTTCSPDGHLLGEVDLDSCECSWEIASGGLVLEGDFQQVLDLKELSRGGTPAPIAVGTNFVASTFDIVTGRLSSKLSLDAEARGKWEIAGALGVVVRVAADRVVWSTESPTLSQTLLLRKEQPGEPPAELRLSFRPGAVLAVASLCCLQPTPSTDANGVVILKDVSGFESLMSGVVMPKAHQLQDTPRVSNCPPTKYEA